MCLTFERNVERDNELRVSGGREFQSLEAMTEGQGGDCGNVM